MSLEDRLWTQLESAAAREARRGAGGRALARVRGGWRASLQPLTAAAVVAAALAAVILSGVLQRTPADREHPPAGADVRQIDGVPTDGVTTPGAVWLYDSHSDAVLGIDPADGHVASRAAIGSRSPRVAMAASPRAIWIVPTPWIGHTAPDAIGAPLILTRIAPRSGQVAARIPVRTPAGDPFVPFGVVAAADSVWVWGPGGALRIDPASGRTVGWIPVHGDAVMGFTVNARAAWLATEGGRLLRADERSGRRTGSWRITPVITRVDLVATGGLLVLGGGRGVVTGIDTRTGRVRWRARPGSSARSFTLLDGQLWVAVSDPVRPRDDLVALDPATGQITSRRPLAAAGAQAVLPVDGALWVVMDRGAVAVVRP
jgi:hypothetical protein